MGWQRPPWTTGCQLFGTPGNFIASFIVAFSIFVAKERSLEMLVELTLALCDMQES